MADTTHTIGSTGIVKKLVDLGDGTYADAVASGASKQVAASYTTNDIAGHLHLSPKTVATHRENILHKLQMSGVAELTRYALREGLSTLDAPCRKAVRPAAAD